MVVLSNTVACSCSGGHSRTCGMSGAWRVPGANTRLEFAPCMPSIAIAVASTRSNTSPAGQVVIPAEAVSPSRSGIERV